MRDLSDRQPHSFWRRRVSRLVLAPARGAFRKAQRTGASCVLRGGTNVLPVRHVCVCLLASGLAPVCADAPIGKGGSIEARSVAGIVAPKELVLYEPTFCGFFIFVSLALVSQGYPQPATHKARAREARGTRYPRGTRAYHPGLPSGGEGGRSYLASWQKMRVFPKGSRTVISWDPSAGPSSSPGRM